MNDINYSTYNIYTFSHSDITQRIAQNDCSDGRCAFIVADCGRTFNPTTFRVGTTTSGKPLSLYIVQKRFCPHYLAAVLNSIVGETMLFERDVIEENKIRFFIGCIKNEDTEFFVKYMANIESVVVSAYKGYFYRVNPDSVMNSGLTIKSLNSIEAQKRMAEYLVEKGIYPKGNSILSNAVQVYAYSAARSKNKDIYDYLHKHYPVGEHMKKMLPHPRIGRKAVSLMYLLLGEKPFFKILSI